MTPRNKVASHASQVLHYVEAFDHTELLERWVPVLARIPDLTVICHVKSEYEKKFGQQYLNLSQVSFRSPGRHEGWAGYLRRLQFSVHDVAVIATLGRRPQWFTPLIGRVRYYVFLHNLNYCFDREDFRLTPRSIKDRLKDLRNTLRKPQKHKLFDRADGLLYASDYLRETGRQHAKPGMNHHYTIPFAHRKYPAKASIDRFLAPLHVVVPGTVTSRARDYDIIIEALKLALPLGAEIEVHLAGRPTEQSIIEKFARALPGIFAGAANSAVNVHYYPSGLSETDFTELLQTTDLILAPLRREAIVGRYREMLGLTKASGTVFDAIYFGKPLLLPAWHPFQDPAVYHFNDGHHLGQLLVDFAQQRNLPKTCWPDSSEENMAKRWSSLIAKNPDRC